MRRQTADTYAERINKVLDYVNAHLYDDVSVERLSRVAGFSKFHFHRQFSAYTGISVAKLVRLMRLKRASFQLAFNKSYPIIDVAYDAGFSNPESFSRAFKKEQGQTPSEFRANPQWEEWTRKCAVPTPKRSNDMQVNIVEFAEEVVAVLEHLGPPDTVMNSVGKFIEWRKASTVSPNETCNTYGVAYSDPAATVPAEFRFDICGSAKSDVPANDHGVIQKTIPGGRCAVVRLVGSTDGIGPTVRQMYADWLPDSGEELREFPCFFHYIKRMPTVAEHEQVTDVYLPLASTAQSD